MDRQRLYVCLGLLGMVCYAPAGPAQVSTDAWPRVGMEVSVLDQKGDVAEELNKENITLKDNGQLQAIDSLLPVNEPRSVCILVDSSGPMYDKREMARTAVMQVLQGLSPKDEICIATFAWSLKVEQTLTLDRAAAEAAARRQLSANGGTSLFDQLIRLGKYMRNSAKFQSRDIIAISDGEDNASATKLADVQEQMKLPGSPTVHFQVHSLRAKQHDLIDRQRIRQVNLDSRPIFQHAKANRILAANELSIWLDAQVEMVRDNMVIRAIRPIPTQQKRSARIRGHSLLRRITTLRPPQRTNRQQ